VAARDFGWLGILDTVARLEATLNAMDGLERFRGHFYNWYGTRDCRPLDPKYVSSVDSGNLAGHLLALAHACREMTGQPMAGGAALAGIADAILLVRESAGARPANRDGDAAARARLGAALDALGAEVDRSPGTAVEVGPPPRPARDARAVMTEARAPVRGRPPAPGDHAVRQTRGLGEIPSGRPSRRTRATSMR
jgi:cyclic beta-1,2-glucan synthetase